MRPAPDTDHRHTHRDTRMVDVLVNVIDVGIPG
jgi:hypothetical protein